MSMKPITVRLNSSGFSRYMMCPTFSMTMRRALETPAQIFALPLTSLEALRFPAEAAQFVFDGKARAAAEQEWTRVAAEGATIVTFSCPQYPERLKQIYRRAYASALGY